MEEAQAKGEVDPATGQPLRLDPADAPVEITGDMVFWVRLDRELAGARNDAGFAWPSEVEAALTRWGIRRPENRDVAKRMLDAIASGRNQALAERIEPEKATPPPRPPTPRKPPRR